jgi:hypothetical protein
VLPRTSTLHEELGASWLSLRLALVKHGVRDASKGSTWRVNVGCAWDGAHVTVIPVARFLLQREERLPKAASAAFHCAALRRRRVST